MSAFDIAQIPSLVLSLLVKFVFELGEEIGEEPKSILNFSECMRLVFFKLILNVNLKV